MCGISVLIQINKNNFDPVSVKKMSDIILHRGPDDEGYVLFNHTTKKPLIFSGDDTPNIVKTAGLSYTSAQNISDSQINNVKVAFGHRRLSIIDLSPAGHQPMPYQDGRYWITYNGEVYNWKELRTELESLGHRFNSHTDTEIILAAYAQWGKDCLHHLNGMWAFVIFDRETNTIFAARDRFGIKPLYYWYSPGGFLAFASEIKQFTVLPGWLPKLNRARAHDFLVHAISDHSHETLFMGVFQIRGGVCGQVLRPGNSTHSPGLPVVFPVWDPIQRIAQ